jgi:hypothetical protein
MHTLETLPLQIVRSRPRISGVRVGRIVRILGARAEVDFDGNPGPPAWARRSASIRLQHLRAALAARASVLLVFNESDPSQPILFDIVDLPTRRRPRESAAAVRPASPPIVPGPRLARIVDVRDGIAFVDFDGNPAGPIPAVSTIVLRNLKDDVLLNFADGTPVIVGQLHPQVTVEPAGAPAGDVVIHCRSLKVQATEEVTLSCGPSKIHLSADGNVVTTGQQIVSRARGANKVQGGSVLLN